MLVAHVLGRAQRVLPLLGAVIAPAQPRQGKKLELSVLVQRLEGAHQLLVRRVVLVVLEHADVAVVGRV